MKISNELLAAYAAGNVSSTEKQQVRQYLMENPLELESVMMMMDEDYELDPYSDADSSVEGATISNLYHRVENSFSDIALSAAAFAPACSIDSQSIQTRRSLGTNKQVSKISFDSQLEKLLGELGF